MKLRCCCFIVFSLSFGCNLKLGSISLSLLLLLTIKLALFYSSTFLKLLFFLSSCASFFIKLLGFLFVLSLLLKVSCLLNFLRAPKSSTIAVSSSYLLKQCFATLATLLLIS